jgi:hypothetical protein
MTKNITDVSAFTDPVVVPANGDARTAVSVETPFQSLSNRTKYLKDWLTLLDSNADGAADCKLRPPAGTATAGTAPIVLTSGTNLTKAEAGAVEYDGKELYFSPGGTRKTVSYDEDPLRPPAGTATADTAPIKLTTGTLNSKAEAGALEFASKALYFTPDATRLTVSLSDHTHTAISGYVVMYYINDSVDEDFTTTDYVSSTLLTLDLTTSELTESATNYVVEVSADLHVLATPNATSSLRLAKTISTTTTEIPGTVRTVMTNAAALDVIIPIHIAFQVSSSDCPVTIEVQGKVGNVSDTLSIKAASSFLIKASKGTVAVTGKGSVS